MDEGLAPGLGETREPLENPFVLRESIAERLFRLDKARDMVADPGGHCALLPIQGWATSRSMTVSTLA